MFTDSINEYAALANRTLAGNVRDGSVVAEWPGSAATILNASSGIASESGEINEIVKKWFFHGHPMDNDSMIHMMKELGDLAWYFVLMCYALNISPANVLAMNIQKLQARYPEGFSTERSINRAPGDI
jgi:NTP pyrophosphatase (non-canonical NTP hydrolase)